MGVSDSHVANHYCPLSHGVAGLQDGVEEAILSLRNSTALSPYEIHERVKDIYTWSNVAERTEKVLIIIIKY